MALKGLCLRRLIFMMDHNKNFSRGLHEVHKSTEEEQRTNSR